MILPTTPSTMTAEVPTPDPTLIQMEQGFSMMHDLLEPDTMSVAMKADLADKCEQMVGWLDEQIAQSMRMRETLLKIKARVTPLVGRTPD